jgi:molybdenum cofactor biosynthesis enzyme MoaA
MPVLHDDPAHAEKQVQVLRDFLYVEPTSVCNLECRMCYTNVLNGPNRRVVEGGTILDFVGRFLAERASPVTLYWCGTGEIFMHRELPRMVNRLLRDWGERLSHVVMTNGTVHRLGELYDVAPLAFRVSIDGARRFHDWHRGEGTYERTLAFCAEAVRRGCRDLTARALLTRDNIDHLDELAGDLRARVAPWVRLLVGAPYTNKVLRPARRGALAIVQHDIEDAAALPREEARRILEERYNGRYELDETPARVDNYLALTTYGVFSCCHGVIRLGEHHEDIGALNERLVASEPACRACALFPCQ